MTDADNSSNSFRILGQNVPPQDYLLWAAAEGIGFHFGQSGEDAILLRLFNKKPTGFYVDVGAFHPRKYSNTFILHALLCWRGINIDASSETILQFDKERPQDINVHCGVGSSKGKKTYYKFDHPARNTLSLENVKRQKHKGDAKLIGEETIAVMPLSEILKRHLPPKTTIDLLNVDVEGYDMQVLESNDWKLFRPRVVLIEDYLVGEGVLEDSEVYKFMQEKGYRIASHAFDTSIYVENNFRPKAYKIDTKAMTNRLEDLGKSQPDLAHRASLLRQDTTESYTRHLEEQLSVLNQQYAMLTQSRSWKVMLPARKLGGAARKVRNSLKSSLQSLDSNSNKDPLEMLKSAKPVRVRSLKEEAHRKGMDKLRDTFVLYRVIGNDLYPRHQKGQSRQNLKFILENEPNLPGCEKIFILNRIIEKSEERAIIRLLKKHKKEYLRIPFLLGEYKHTGLDVDCFPKPGYLASQEFESMSESVRQLAMTAVYRLKNNYIMNNNGARNVALADGKDRAKWILPWDGNCFVTKSAWEQITKSVTSKAYLKYFVVPMMRITDNNILLSDNIIPNPIEEPQLIFRRDAEELFDENYSYGRRPKVELFWRLGIPGKWDDWLDEPWDQQRNPVSTEAHQFGVAGWVARLFSGASELEQNSYDSAIKRGKVRNEAIINTIREVDASPNRARPFTETTFYDTDTLKLEVDSYRRGKDPKLASVIKSLILEANRALERKPYSVVEKTTLPPSGDPHDYWSTAPYWWPNPKTADGLPYIRKDGQWVPGSELFGPESEKYDRSRIQGVFTDSITLALAWKFTNDDRYVAHAASMLERFFINPDTRMNPNLQFAQVRMGHNGNLGAPAGIIETKDIYFYLDAVKILMESGVLDDKVVTAFKGWLSDYLGWLLESNQGIAERLALNNHATSYDLQVIAIAEFIGDEATLFDVLARAQSRIAQQFAADGSQPEELARTNSLHYSCFNYQEWINIARIAKKWGVNLWDYEHKDGASLRKGGEWLLSFANKPWPYEQINPFDAERFSVIRFTVPPQYIDNTLVDEFPDSPYDVGLEIGPRRGADPNPYNGIQPYWNLGLPYNFSKDK